VKAAEILEVDTLAFIEPSFAALTDPLYTDMLAATKNGIATGNQNPK